MHFSYRALYYQTSQLRHLHQLTKFDGDGGDVRTGNETTKEYKQATDINLQCGELVD